jgi:DNA-binding NtrC family response regulator
MQQMYEKKHLLIVDDELLIRDLLYDHFSNCDYSISLADSGQSALELSAKTDFNAVILDLKMPDIDGLELAVQIRARQKDVPIIIITGYPSIESAVVALRQRYFDYFVKPFNMKKLEKSVNAAVEKHLPVDHHSGEEHRA